MVAILLDGNNLAIRSFLAPKQDMSVDGVDTGTLVLFINSLARYVKLYRPHSGLICWDGGYSAYRVHMFPEYKANRKQKYSDDPTAPFELLYEFLYLAGFPQLQLPGYEGDDLIAAVWRACRGREQLRIISSDKDLHQLIDDSTEQVKLTSRHEKADEWNKVRFIKEKGYRPEQVPLVLALTGDKVDGIPGLPRVGPKTAVKMLTECNWDVERLLKRLPKDQQEVVLLNIALMDLSLVPLDLDPPPTLNLVHPGHKHWGTLSDFLDNYKLKNIKERLMSDSLWN